MKNRPKSVFLSDKFISNLNVFNNIKITLYCSVYMRTSDETLGGRSFLSGEGSEFWAPVAT